MRKPVRFFTLALLVLTLAAIAAIAGLRFAASLRETQEASAIAPANGQFVETSFGRLHVSNWGDPKGKPVLMTHGMAAWGGLWVETAEALAANGYQVIALDQAPFGFSDRDNTDFSRTAQAARIKEVLDALGIEKTYLVGHSYGGGVTLEAALRYPERVAGLVLVCPVTDLPKADDADQAGAPNALPLLLRSTKVAEFLVSATVTNPMMTRFLMQKFMHRKDAITDDHIAILQRPMSRVGNTHAMTLWLQQFLAGDPDAWSAKRDRVRHLAVPAELIWGEKDTVTPISQGDDLAHLAKFGAFQRLPEIGHMPQIESSAVFNAALIQALGRLSANAYSSWGLRVETASR